uniref:DEP domain-containing protein n=1 Tax=Vannella robusta TaxID=1487602 RepID=A0A7S4HGZ1_9EUKA
MEVNLHERPSLWKEMRDRTGGKSSVPQIFFHSDYIGGCSDLEKLVAEGKLNDRLQTALLGEDGSYWDFLEKSIDQTSTSSVNEELHVPCHGITPEMLKIYETMRSSTGIEMRTKLQGLKLIRNCFTGADVEQWLVRTLEVPKSSATVLAQKLLDLRFFCPQGKHSNSSLFDSEVIYKCFEDIVPSLNTKTDWSGEVRPATEVIDEMRRLLLDLECRFIAQSGREVDYKAISESSAFKNYKLCVMELQKVSLAGLSEHEMLAFFINTYNILMIHGAIEYGPPKDALSRRSFFHKVSYLIDGDQYSLHDIEHGILRCNRKPPGSLFKTFGNSDPRSKYILKVFDPRIHFTLVCGAKSCPPIKVYNAETIDEALQIATESFISEEVVADLAKREVKMSRLFDWFANDFGESQEDILLFVLPFCGGEQKTALVKLLGLDRDKIKVSYSDYDWNLNIGSMDEHHEDFL